LSVKLRLKKMGRKKRPFYRLVAIDSRKRRDGLEVEKLGWFNPLPNNLDCKINEERVLFWLDKGAQPSDTVKGLFRRQGLSYKWYLMDHGIKGLELDKLLEEWHVRENNRIKKNKDKKIKKKELSQIKEEAPVEAATDEAPAEEAPVEAAADEAPAEEALAEEAPVEAATEEAPAEEAPAEEASAEEAPVEAAAEAAQDESDKKISANNDKAASKKEKK